MLAGDFSTYLCSACQCSPITLNSAYTQPNNQTTGLPEANQIQAALLQTPSALIAQKIVALMPPVSTTSPGVQNPCGVAYYQSYTSTDETEGISRVDWQRTQNDSLFGR